MRLRREPERSVTRHAIAVFPVNHAPPAGRSYLDTAYRQVGELYTAGTPQFVTGLLETVVSAAVAEGDTPPPDASGTPACTHAFPSQAAAATLAPHPIGSSVVAPVTSA